MYIILQMLGKCHLFKDMLPHCLWEAAVVAASAEENKTIYTHIYKLKKTQIIVWSAVQLLTNLTAVQYQIFTTRGYKMKST